MIRSGYACIDSGATHDMSNRQAFNFANYWSLPKGSHVLVADNHPLNVWALVPRSGDTLWVTRKFFMSQLLRHHFFQFDSIINVKAALSLLTIMDVTSPSRLSPFPWMIVWTVSLHIRPLILMDSISPHATIYKVLAIRESLATIEMQ